MKFYKDHYDVVIIGGALAGMSACLQLQAWGIKDILILEKHNMPGGLATDFVRNGFEIEATLHEMMSIGQPGKRLKVGKPCRTPASTRSCTTTTTTAIPPSPRRSTRSAPAPTTRCTS